MSATATPGELEQARKIKAAALGKGLKPVADLVYLQHAIVAKDKVSKAVKRLEKMERFRDEYGATNAENDDALSLLRESYAMFPGFLGCVGRSDDGRGVQISIVEHYTPSRLTEEQWRVVLLAGVYMFDALNCDVEAMRRGMMFVSDCSNMGWKNFSLTAQRKQAAVFQDAYPIRFSVMHLLNPPAVMEFMLKLVRPLLSKKMKEMIQLGKSDEFYANWPKHLTPAQNGGSATDEEGFAFLESQLLIRMKNEKEFKL